MAVGTQITDIHMQIQSVWIAREGPRKEEDENNKMPRNHLQMGEKEYFYISEIARHRSSDCFERKSGRFSRCTNECHDRIAARYPAGAFNRATYRDAS